MGRYLTRDCDCTALTGTGQKRPESCEHGIEVDGEWVHADCAEDEGESDG